MLQLPQTRTANESRQVLRVAVRQMERADLYLAAVGAMELDNRQAARALNQLRADLDALRRHLIELRAST
jgi:Holliday junction resolvasome RuvABC ATP-dependent DNA helicase subunit